MEDKNLSKALEIVSRLLTGEEVGRDDKGSAGLYDEYVNKEYCFCCNITAMPETESAGI